MEKSEEIEYRIMDEDINKELTAEVIRPIFLLIHEAVKTYNTLINDKNDIFKGEYFEEIKGRLVSYMIKRAFDRNLVSEKFPFEISCAKMAYNQKRPELRKGNILLTIAKSNDINELPSKSGYKEKYSAGNSLIAKQLRFKEVDSLQIEAIPYYGIVCYNYSENNLKFLDIVFPDNKYKNIVKRITIPMIFELPIGNDNESGYNNESSLLDSEALKDLIKIDIKNKKI